MPDEQTQTMLDRVTAQLTAEPQTVAQIWNRCGSPLGTANLNFVSALGLAVTTGLVVRDRYGKGFRLPDDVAATEMAEPAAPTVPAKRPRRKAKATATTGD